MSSLPELELEDEEEFDRDLGSRFSSSVSEGLREMYSCCCWGWCRSSLARRLLLDFFSAISVEVGISVEEDVWWRARSVPSLEARSRSWFGWGS